MLAEEAGETLGGCQLIRVADDPGLLWVVGFYIRPAWRRRGCGRAFLEAVVERLGAWEARGLVLTVHPHNVSALRLYQSFGFHRVDSVPEFYGYGEERELLILDPASSKGEAEGGCDG